MWNWVHNNNSFASAFKILIIMRPASKALVIWYKSWSDNTEQSLLQHTKLFFLRLCLSTKIATMSVFSVELKSSFSVLFYATRRFGFRLTVSFGCERHRVSCLATYWLHFFCWFSSLEWTANQSHSSSLYAVTQQKKIKKRNEFFKTSKRCVLDT